jgi:hypothetical protein
MTSKTPPKVTNPKASEAPAKLAKARKPAGRQSEKADPDDPVPLLPTGEGTDLIPVDTLIRYNTFVDHYLQTLDCAAAAKEAGWEGRNEAAQRALGGNLLRNPYIRTRIEKQYRSIIAKTDATPERVWEEISYIAFLDPAVFYDEDGEVKPWDQIPEAARRAITGMKVKTGTIGEDGEFTEREVKYAGKQAALDMLVRLHRMADNDKMVLVSGDEFVKAMEEGRQRAASRQ